MGVSECFAQSPRSQLINWEGDVTVAGKNSPGGKKPGPEPDPGVAENHKEGSTRRRILNYLCLPGTQDMGDLDFLTCYIFQTVRVGNE